MATMIEQYYKEEDEDSYNYKKTILKMAKMKTVEKTRKRDNFKYNDVNDDVEYDDDECEDIGKVREI